MQLNCEVAVGFKWWFGFFLSEKISLAATPSAVRLVTYCDTDKINFRSPTTF